MSFFDEDIPAQEKERLINSLEHDIPVFIEIFAGLEPSDKQKEFIGFMKTWNHLVAIWSRQSGKSTIVSGIIVHRLLYGKGMIETDPHTGKERQKMPEQIAILAPIKDNLDNLYDKISSIIDKNEFISEFVIKKNHDRIVMKNGNFAKFMSASPGAKIRGFTATMIVIDETQDISDNKYNADILPFGATTDALIIEAGTPKEKNHFYNTINSDSAKVVWQKWYECPFISEAYVMKQKDNSPDALWRQEYLCEFIEEGVLAFPSWLFEEEKNLEGVPTGRWNLAEYTPLITKEEDITKEVLSRIHSLVEDEKATFTMGLDLGKTKDNTVLVCLRTDVRPIRYYTKMVFPLQTKYSDIARVAGILHKAFRPSEFNFDYTNEKGYKERLLENDVPVVDRPDRLYGAIPFTNKSKTEMVTNARMLLEKFQVQLPMNDEKLLMEFKNQQFEVNEGGLYKYYHPSNEHDDSLWASLLALKNVNIIDDGGNINAVDSWKKHDEFINRSSETQEKVERIKSVRAVKTLRVNRNSYIPRNFLS